MLPSADAAMVAFAEVTSFVRFYAQTQGVDALPRLLQELRGARTDEALTAASGADLKTWDTRWRAYLASRPKEAVPSLFGLEGARTDAERMRDFRDRTRLAGLLLARNVAYAPAALLELDRIEMAGAPVSEDAWDRAMGDPSVRWLRGRALEESGRREQGEPLVADPLQVLTSYAPWWAMRGRWAHLRSDEPTAVASFAEALASDPFDMEAACETIDPHAEVPEAARALCDAARARGEPAFESD
jgi:hypothetical protein